MHSAIFTKTVIRRSATAINYAIIFGISFAYLWQFVITLVEYIDMIRHSSLDLARRRFLLELEGPHVLRPSRAALRLCRLLVHAHHVHCCLALQYKRNVLLQPEDGFYM